jgi:Polyprenyl synthetase
MLRSSGQHNVSEEFLTVSNRRIQGQREVAANRTRMHERVEWVFAFLEELITTLPVPPSHRELLRVHLGVGREQAKAYPELPAIQLPLLVHAAITGDEGPALPVAGACTSLYLGADLLDNVIDHELSPIWDIRDPAEAHLAAATLLAAIPQLSLSRLQGQGTPVARLWALTHSFVETLLTMSAGEHEDLLFTKSEDVTPERCRTMCERKSGSELALFARAGAILATEDVELTERYAAFGLCLGTATQICTDVWDIWKGKNSRDLLNGKRTLPIVHALTMLRGGSRERLRELLGAVRNRAQCHDEVRTLLLEAGSVHYTGLIVEVYRQRARNHLAAASPKEPAGQALRMILDGTSLLSTGESATY